MASTDVEYKDWIVKGALFIGALAILKWLGLLSWTITSTL